MGEINTNITNNKKNQRKMTGKYLFYVLLHALQCSPKRVYEFGILVKQMV